FDGLRPDLAAQFTAAECTMRVDRIAPAHIADKPSFSGVVVSEVSRALPPHSKLKHAVWDEVLSEGALHRILREQVVERASTTYQTLCREAKAALGDRSPDGVPQQSSPAHAAQVALDILSRESKVAGLLLMLRDKRQYTLLESLFFNQADASAALWTALVTA